MGTCTSFNVLHTLLIILSTAGDARAVRSLEMSSAKAILKRAVKLVPTHGFTRETLALSEISDAADGRGSPLSETAVSALFGPGHEATKTLIKAWMDEGREDMKLAVNESAQVPDIQSVLLRRLRWNERALPHLKDVSVGWNYHFYHIPC